MGRMKWFHIGAGFAYRSGARFRYLQRGSDLAWCIAVKWTGPGLPRGRLFRHTPVNNREHFLPAVRDRFQLPSFRWPRYRWTAWKGERVVNRRLGSQSARPCLEGGFEACAASSSASTHILCHAGLEIDGPGLPSVSGNKPRPQQSLGSQPKIQRYHSQYQVSVAPTSMNS
jgi:hypothetical protein